MCLHAAATGPGGRSPLPLMGSYSTNRILSASADALYGQHGGRADDRAGSRERVQHAVAAATDSQDGGREMTAQFAGGRTSPAGIGPCGESQSADLVATVTRRQRAGLARNLPHIALRASEETWPAAEANGLGRGERSHLTYCASGNAAPLRNRIVCPSRPDRSLRRTYLRQHIGERLHEIWADWTGNAEVVLGPSLSSVVVVQTESLASWAVPASFRRRLAPERPYEQILQRGGVSCSRSQRMHR